MSQINLPCAICKLSLSGVLSPGQLRAEWKEVRAEPVDGPRTVSHGAQLGECAKGLGEGCVQRLQGAESMGHPGSYEEPHLVQATLGAGT